MTNLISENRIDWDEHLSIMLFSYRIAYKITTRYTLYQLMHGLHLIYIIPMVSGNEKDNAPVKNLTSRIIELEKFQEIRMQVAKITRIQ